MSFVEQIGQKAVGRVGETIKARREKRDALLPKFCLNCGTEARKFCPECGQENTPHAVHMGELFRDVWDEFIKADNKFFRTMIPLLFRPGYMTRQYAEGKRARYLSPSRLYLVVSALFFYLLSQHAPTPRSGNGVTLGQQIAQWQKDTQAKQAAKQKNAGATFHTHANTKKAPKEIDIGFGGDDDAPVRHVRVGQRSFDLFTVPDTWDKYETDQQKLDVAKRDDWFSRWLTGRIIAAKGFTKKSFFDHFLDTLPKVMFVMMPAFAFLLKVLYVRSPRRYVEHFVLSLHVHTVYFCVSGLALLLPLRGVVTVPLIALYMVFYGFWAMKTVYGQSLSKTFLKWFLLTWNYGFALQVGFILALILSLAF